MRVIEDIKSEVRKIMKNDSAHDFEHLMRVYNNAKKICEKEKANTKLVLTAALLHDLVSYPKSDKRSKKSSINSAKKAKRLLKKYPYSENEIDIVYDAIINHSYSRNKSPKSVEGKILQDADRLDAIGAIGIARVFAVGGSEKRPFYNVEDPFCQNRKPNDQSYTLDHFYQKLLLLESSMNTESGRKEAGKRTKILKDFLVNLEREIS